MVQIGSQTILYIVLSMCYFLAIDLGKRMSGLVLSFEPCLENNKDNIYPPRKEYLSIRCLTISLVE